MVHGVGGGGGGGCCGGGGGGRWTIDGGRWWRVVGCGWWAVGGVAVVGVGGRWWCGGWGGPVMSARLRLKAQGLLLRVSGIEFTSKGVGKGCQC